MAPTTKVHLLALLSAISAPLALAHGQVKYVVANGVKNEAGNVCIGCCYQAWLQFPLTPDVL